MREDVLVILIGFLFAIAFIGFLFLAIASGIWQPLVAVVAIFIVVVMIDDALTPEHCKEQQAVYTDYYDPDC